MISSVNSVIMKVEEKTQQEDAVVVNGTTGAAGGEDDSPAELRRTPPAPVPTNRYKTGLNGAGISGPDGDMEILSLAGSGGTIE